MRKPLSNQYIYNGYREITETVGQEAIKIDFSLEHLRLTDKKKGTKQNTPKKPKG